MFQRILEIGYYLDTMIPVDFIQLESVSSTQTWAKDHIRDFNPLHLTCITAHEQTAGRGRQNRKWLSPKGVNLYATLYFTVPSKASYLANLGQIMALSSAELLHEMNVPAEIKWPNDILVMKKKIGGVLTETIPQEKKIGVILGLGLNVNMPEKLLKTIDQPATSLHLILHKKIEPLSLLEPLLKFFTSNLSKLQADGFAPFQPQFDQLLAFKQESITLQLPQKIVQGICVSITPEGCLKLKLSTGQFLTLSIGEIL